MAIRIFCDWCGDECKEGNKDTLLEVKRDDKGKTHQICELCCMKFENGAAAVVVKIKKDKEVVTS